MVSRRDHHHDECKRLGLLLLSLWLVLSGALVPQNQHHQERRRRPEGRRWAVVGEKKVKARMDLGSEVKGEFPALDQEVREGQRLLYLDSGATSQKPRCVLEAERRYYEKDNANVHRGAHALATRATEAYEKAREKIAKFINASSASEIVFTRGATEALNLVAQSYGENLNEGDEIVLTVAEHHANLVPWQLLASRKGLVLKFAQLTKDHQLDVDHLKSLLTEKTRVVSTFHVSNVLGAESPVSEIVQLASRCPDCVVVLDACQSVPHCPVDVQSLGVDFIVASGHKMCGPMGVGFLWGKKDQLDKMPPWQGGGEMIDQVTLSQSTFAPAPARFEAGTPPVAQAVGLGAAVDFLSNIGMAQVQAHEKLLAKRLLEGLLEREYVSVIGPTDPSLKAAALVAFNVDGVHASDLSFFLDQEGVAVRAGHHCTQPLHHYLDLDSGTCRASLALYNTPQDVADFLLKLDKVVDFFKDGLQDDLLLGGADDSSSSDLFVPLPGTTTP